MSGFGRAAAEAVRVLAGLLGTAVLTAALGLLAWTVLPAASGWQPSVVLTGSMAPALLPGDVVVVAPARPGDPVVGRVVVFTDPARPGRTVVHRVEEVLPDGAVRTRGDANPSADAVPVPAAAVEGVARLRVPAVGLPLLWLAEGRWGPLAGFVLASVVVVRAALDVLVPAPGPGHGRRRAPAQKREVVSRLRSTPSQPGRVRREPWRAGFERYTT